MPPYSEKIYENQTDEKIEDLENATDANKCCVDGCCQLSFADVEQ